MIDLPPELKERVIKDLQEFAWNSASRIGNNDEVAGWVITAFSPKFEALLEKSAGENVAELQRLIGGCTFWYMRCLLSCITIAIVGDSLRLDVMKELFGTLGELYGFISEEEHAYVQSITADRAEQPLPEFLRMVVSHLHVLLDEYVLAFMRDMEQPSDEIVTHLLSQCRSPKEKAELAVYIERINGKAEELLADEDVSAEDILDELISFVSSFFDPEQ